MDPAPESYRPYSRDGKYLSVDFPLVRDLVAARPEIVGNCVLFLCWPAVNDSVYDYEAVTMLKPLAAVVVYSAKSVRNASMRRSERLAAPPCTAGSTPWGPPAARIITAGQGIMTAFASGKWKCGNGPSERTKTTAADTATWWRHVAICKFTVRPGSHYKCSPPYRLR